MIDNIILVVGRLEDNSKYRKGEEILARTILNKSGLKYKIIEYSQTNNRDYYSLTSDLPFIYYDKHIIPSVNIPIFLFSLTKQENSEALTQFSNLCYYSKDILRNLIERYKQLTSSHENSLISQIILNSTSACVTQQLMKENNHLNKIKFNEKNNILLSIESIYDKINNKYLKNQSSLSLFNKILLFSFLKESYLQMNSLVIQEIELNGLVFKNISNYIDSMEETVRDKKMKFELLEENQILINNYSLELKKKDGKPSKKANEIQSEGVFWHNFISISMFCSFGLIVWYLSNKNNTKVKTANF